MPGEEIKSLFQGRDGRLLLRAIQREKCIVVLGPGVAIAPDDPLGQSLTVRLAETLAAELDKQDKHVINRTDLAHVAQVYEREMPKRRPGLEMAVEEFYTPYRGLTTSLHRDLAALPFTLCVSTTPDRFLLNAFAQATDKKPIYAFHHFQPDPTRARERPAPRSPPESEPEKHPLIFDLYGSLDEPDSLVLTENNLLDFLVSVARQTPALHPYVSSQFSDLAVSFLFLGLGFHQWYVRILLHVLKAAGHTQQSLALEDATFFGLPGLKETALFYQSGHFLEFKQFPWPDFVAELRRSYEAAAKPTPSTAAALPDSAPIAFLCHENRDKTEAERVGRELEAEGVKIWLDRQNLRGGDNWRKAIPAVIGKQCDYLVVLQSPRMLDKTESYFKAEIEFALERQPSFGNLRFVIPVILEQDSRLPLHELPGDLHFIDLPRQGTRALAEAILEDWEKRRKIKGS
jgi:TIR domain/SIR2-like domain